VLLDVTHSTNFTGTDAREPRLPTIIPPCRALPSISHTPRATRHAALADRELVSARGSTSPGSTPRDTQGTERRQTDSRCTASDEQVAARGAAASSASPHHAPRIGVAGRAGERWRERESAPSAVRTRIVGERDGARSSEPQRRQRRREQRIDGRQGRE